MDAFSTGKEVPSLLQVFPVKLKFNRRGLPWEQTAKNQYN